MKSKLIASLCLFFLAACVRADTFIVTKNADGGSGSLRAAITLANANGTSTPDFIHFDIADQTETGCTINLQSELPALSSNITIDGTTQAGNMLGLSNARVTLYLDRMTVYPFTYLFIHNATSVNVYGVCFKYFEDPNNGGGLHYGIGMRNVSDIRIGAPGKGNLFTKVREGISNSYWNYFTPDSAKNITIQSNVFGMSSNNLPVQGGMINLKGAANIMIGGPTAAEGNMHVGAGIFVTQLNNSAHAYFLKMLNNKINVNWNETVFYYSFSVGIDIWGNFTDEPTTTKTWIANNVICALASDMVLNQMFHRTLITGNRIGLNAAGAACMYHPFDLIIGLTSKNVIIGGYSAADQNIIHGNIYGQKHGTHVIQNQISGIINNTGTAEPDPFIRITAYENNLIRGVANGNAKIQLYSTECHLGNYTCYLKRYYATTWADASGNWSYPYTAATPNLIATSTMYDSSTSAFTKINVDISTYRITTHATCGKNNGSITGIKVYQGLDIRWVNSSNQIVSTDTNLVNVPAGNYSLLISLGPNSCGWGQSFTIENFNPPPAVVPTISPAACGQPTGSIYYQGVSSFFRNIWYNNVNDSIGNGSMINNLPPGNYYLNIKAISDTSCNRLYGPFTVSNASGPSLNLNNVVLTSATCGNNNGSIAGITTSNVAGTPFLRWVDSLNNYFGNTLNIANLAPGKYRLKLKDVSICDTIISPYFTIANTGQITINSNLINITGSDCGATNGSITQIQVNGANAFQWVNAAGIVVANTLNLQGIAAGTYILKATNSYGCTKITDSILVPNTPFITNLGSLQITLQSGRCNKNDGSIIVGNFPDANLYSFFWVDSLQPATISGTGLTLNNINSGTYFLYAKNANGCQEKIATIRLPHLTPVSIDVSSVLIKPTTCMQSNGSIQGLHSEFGTGSAPFTFTWLNASGANAGNLQNLNQAAAGSYTFIIKDADGCADSSNFTVANQDIVLPEPIYANQTILTGTVATLSGTNQQPGTYFLYETLSATTPIAQNQSGIFSTPLVAQNTTFYVEHRLGNCVSKRTSVDVAVANITRIYVPSAFTPNKDGVNDLLKPVISGVAQTESFTIYNKYGQRVFSTKDPTVGWDGRYMGNLQPLSSYVWIYQGKDGLNGVAFVERGTFILLR